MKKVLLTGANGFIGRQTIPFLLESGFEVHATDMRVPEERVSGIHWHSSDLLNSDHISKLMSDILPTHLLHFAWYSVPGKYWTSKENIQWVQASIELLQAFSKHQGHRAVMAGTCAEYDWEYGYCSEHLTPPKPTSLYGNCKHALETILSSFSIQTGLSSAWGRIFFLYGPYEHPKRLISSVINSLLRNKPALCSHGRQIRDFLYVRDVAEAFVKLLESNVSGAINIASGQPVTLKNIIETIGDKLNKKDLIQLGALPVSSNEPHLLVADVGRLTNEVGFLPKHNLESGIEQTIQWWKAFLSNESSK